MFLRKRPRNHRRRPARTTTGEVASEIDAQRDKPSEGRVSQTKPPPASNVISKKKFRPDSNIAKSGLAVKESGPERQSTTSAPAESRNPKPQTCVQSKKPQGNQQQQQRILQANREPQGNQQQQQRVLQTSRNAKQPQNSTSRPATTKTFFKKHMSEDEIREGLANGTLLKGQIRINQKKFEEAFIDNPNGSEFPDIAVLGMPDRNRALQGDVVAIRIKPRCNWVVNEDAYKNWKKDSGSKQPGSAADESRGDNTVMEVVEELIETTASLESAVAGSDKVVCSQVKFSVVRLTMSDEMKIM
ncbi:hypothetical protein COOONC_15068 [Cooperia oncophora]